MSIIQLENIRFQNVRGFYDAILPLNQAKSLIVGRNHAGKTSAFLLLEWLINRADPNSLLKGEDLSFDEQSFLLPSRDAKHTARRITVALRIPDGRTARRFNSINNLALLRIGFRVSGNPRAFIQLGEARRDSGDESEPKAAELLSLIQQHYSVIYIPSARDAGSNQFKERFKNLFKDKLAERAHRTGRQSGATSEYRKMLKATDSLKSIAEELLNPVLEELVSSLQAGMLQTSELHFNKDLSDSALDWIIDQTTLKLVTGEHDNMGVAPTDVGAGLQSVLDIAIASMILKESKIKPIVAVEEPEAFLHPSMQRAIARLLLSPNYGNQILISTHSPILVEEAHYKDIIVAVDRTFQQPIRTDEPNREEIHTALLTGQGAEMVFATSVLLVEGEGDRLFFEGLRRRMAEHDTSGRVDFLFAIQTGGKTSFAPWIKLLRDLSGAGTSRIPRYVIAPDGDATRDMQRAFNDCNISIVKTASDLMQSCRSHIVESNYSEYCKELLNVNKALKNSVDDFPLRFLEGDLEYAIFIDVPGQTCRRWADKWGLHYENKLDFIKMMGSKAIDGSSAGNHKNPYLRKQLAEWIPSQHISTSIKDILLPWLTNGGFKEKEAVKLLESI